MLSKFVLVCTHVLMYVYARLTLGLLDVYTVFVEKYFPFAYDPIYILYNTLLSCTHTCTHTRTHTHTHKIIQSCSKMCTAVEESTQHSDCKAITFSSTVFDDLPMMTSVTVFEKLPAFTSKLVYEDASNSLVSVIH